jgi:hypothetical protein
MGVPSRLCNGEGSSVNGNEGETVGALPGV